MWLNYGECKVNRSTVKYFQALPLNILHDSLVLGKHNFQMLGLSVTI